MSDLLDQIRSIIQEDVGKRGLAKDPDENLLTACPRDFHDACRCLVDTESPAVGIVTGFFIAHGQPPTGETDGPLGALFLARVLSALGAKVVLATDDFCFRALEIGLAQVGLRKMVPLVKLPRAVADQPMSPAEYREYFSERAGRVSHLIAIERPGPSHTPDSVRAQPGATPALVEEFVGEVPAEYHNRCISMWGKDITYNAGPAHYLFEKPSLLAGSESAANGRPALVTIGIGDGGNEIGMGKIPWNVIRNNIPLGNILACRVPTDHLIVSGVSNWGAYGLGAGILKLKNQAPPEGLFDPEQEQQLLEMMVERGPLVDGLSGMSHPVVDGMLFEDYIKPFEKIGSMFK